MLVSQILEAKGHDVVTVGPDQPIWAVLRSFRLHGIGALVVVGEDGVLLGLLGERDIVNGLTTRGKKILDLTVREVMSTSVPTCAPSDSITASMRTMTDKRARHLPVVEAGKLCGLVSIGDVVKARLDDFELENRVLRDMARSHGQPS